MTGKCINCLHAHFRETSIAGSYEWKGVCTATRNLHYIEQGWTCSCNRYELRPILRKKEVSNEVTMGCDED